MVSFSDLGVPAHLVDRLAHRGILAPFPIQAATVPDALAGRDVFGQAPTGSGKTLAFGLALVDRATGSAPGHPRGLVLVPTRELASQVCEELAQLAGGRRPRIIAVYGGTAYGPTRRALAGGVDIVVACPGRLMDLVEQGAIALDQVRVAVLDEADRMADMGFLPVVRKLLDATQPDRQVLLFSATVANEVESVVRQYQRDPARHQVAGDQSSVGEVTHVFWQVDRTERVGLVASLVGDHGQAIVFCRTKRAVDRVARQLGGAGVQAVPIHGDRTQKQRERALATFSSGKAGALVATDVAARGIHIDDLPCVIHYDLPPEPTDYVHRSGRTGRAGNRGTVVSLVTEEQRATARSLQRALGLPQKVLPAGSVPPAAEPATAGLPTTAPPAAEPPATGAVDAHRTPRRNHKGNRDRSRKDRSRNKAFGSTPGATPAAGPTGSSTKATPKSAAPKSAAPKSAAPQSAAPQSAVAQRERRGIMPTGTVKFFNTEKGYGFVSRPDGEDLFVHYSNVQGSGFRTLEAGQQVEFDIAPGRKGDEARNVKII